MDNPLFSVPAEPSRAAKIKRLLTRPWVIVSMVGFLAILVAGFSVNSLVKAFLHSREEVLVPELEGKGLMDAIQIVSALNLSIAQEGSEFDETLPAGTIMRQHPPAGMQVRAGRTIRVMLSKGGQVVFVPGVVGKPLTEAQSLFGVDRLQVGAVTSVFSLDMGEGLVISQNPSSGTVVTRGALIDVVVSKGIAPVGASTVPNFVGKTLAEAQQWTTDAGGQVETMEDSKAMGQPGSVVKQDPLPGQPFVDDKILSVVVIPKDEAGVRRYSFTVPGDKDTCVVRILKRGTTGETEIFKGTKEGGDTVSVPVKVVTATRIRVYVDGRLSKEEVLQP